MILFVVIIPVTMVLIYSTVFASGSPTKITYRTIYYEKMLQEILDIQMSKNPQTDLSGKWASANRKQVENFLHPNYFLQFTPKGDSNDIVSIKITADILNVREGPSTSTKILTTVKKNQVYIVLDESNSWYKINKEGIVGWVSNEYVRYTNGAPKEMFQFLLLSGSSGITLEELNAELKGKGILDGMGQAFIDGAKTYDINEIYLLSHALLETGHGKSKLANGILVDNVEGEPVEPRVVYNMFGIGAYDSAPNRLGSEYAYKQGWFSPEEAIIGGAKWIAGNYINHSTYKQNILYKMRWNPARPGVHQYATDIGWAYKQTKTMDLFIEICDRSNSVKLTFEIPVYKNNNKDNIWWQYKEDWHLIDNNGLMKTGWQKVGNKWYYMHDSGVMASGWIRLNGKWYYLASSGAMQTGFQDIKGKTYYMNKSGVMLTGWQTIEGKTYYMNSSGVVQKNTIIDGKKLGLDGTLLSGWERMDNNWYYYKDGIMQTGWQKVGNKWYYMHDSGVMASGWIRLNGKWYYLASSGAMQTGFQDIKGKTYYMNKSGVMLTGWQTIEGKTYYMNSSGVVQKNTIIDGKKLGLDGALLSGWERMDNNWYYYKDGIIQTGWQKVDGKWYYMDSSGAMQTGWLKSGSKWYYLSSSGAMETGWTKVGSKWYYMNSTGAMQIGWQKVGDKWYYLYSDGSMAANTTIDGYKLGNDGAMLYNNNMN